jgi:hypothetical protein
VNYAPHSATVLATKGCRNIANNGLSEKPLKLYFGPIQLYVNGVVHFISARTQYWIPWWVKYEHGVRVANTV